MHGMQEHEHEQESSLKSMYKQTLRLNINNFHALERADTPHVPCSVNVCVCVCVCANMLHSASSGTSACKSALVQKRGIYLEKSCMLYGFPCTTPALAVFPHHDFVHRLVGAALALLLAAAVSHNLHHANPCGQSPLSTQDLKVRVSTPAGFGGAALAAFAAAGVVAGAAAAGAGVPFSCGLLAVEQQRQAATINQRALTILKQGERPELRDTRSEKRELTSFAVAAVALLLRLGHHRFHDCRSGLPGYSFTSRPRPAKGLLLFPSVCAIRKS
eukprot:1153372-Pelagomonas_calceolata.AAC.6